MFGETQAPKESISDRLKGTLSGDQGLISRVNIKKPLNSPESWFPVGLRSWVPARPVAVLCPPGVFPVHCSTGSTMPKCHRAGLPPASLLFTAAAQEKDFVKKPIRGPDLLGVHGGWADQVQGVQNGPWYWLFLPLWSPVLPSKSRSAVELHRPHCILGGGDRRVL